MELGEVGSLKGRGERPSGKLSHLSYFKRHLRSELLYARPSPFTHLPHFRPRKPGPKAGLAYEAKILQAISSSYKSSFLSHLCFTFDEGKGKKCAIPDGLLFSHDWKECCIIEVKIRHTADAYHQLNDFYVPIVHRAFGSALRVFGLEICRYYDPLVKLPRPPAHLISLKEAFEIRDGFHPVITWSRFDGRVA